MPKPSPETENGSIMRRSLKRSNRHFEQALKRLPVGVTSTFRYWGPERTIYADHARGARLWDIDGNEYVDYRLGYGPTILGYCDPRVDAAARAGMETGGAWALSTQRELAVAERIAGMVPAAELVRFANSGTEAVMGALRLARGYTGKDAHVMVEGGFHGLFDLVQWQAMVELSPDEAGEPMIRPEGKGVPRMLRSLVHLVPLNDANRLEDVLRKHGDEIAAFLIEPIMGNCCGITASAQYVVDARALCDRYEVVMIVDEVKTGFRVARGGVQELMGVRADLCTFAKAIANGYPISALAGREEIMRKIGPQGVAQGGTFVGHPVSMAAAEKTLEILDETDALDRIEAYGRRLQQGLGEILDRRGVAHVFEGHPSMGGLFFAESAPKSYRDWADSDYTFYNDLAGRLNDLGILCEPDSREPWFICASHDDACLAETLEKFETALDGALESQGGAAAG
jgi:glutamate-1-semialdehyde 2,1-aminomutase